jgi:addiction module HigA family antidote
MKTRATLGGEITACGQVLYMVLELSSRTWKVLLRSANGRQRERSVAAGDLAALKRQMTEAKRKLGLAEDARVVSCYEAGRDGFWLHRALLADGVESLVVDSSSIEVPRRSRHKKTDRLDLYKLMALLVRYLGGERGRLPLICCPTPHPGVVLLEEFLKPMGLSQTALANALHVPPRRINEVVLGKRAVTADNDLRLARYFGLSEGFFLGLQTDYELMTRRRQIGDQLKAIRPRAA